MFDRLEDLGRRLEEILNQLGEPGVANDQNLYRKLMKEQAELAPIVEKYNEYKAAKEGIEDSLAILDEETDEEMRELAKEELNDCKERLTETENELKILLLPKDPNDEKNVIVEIRAVQVVMRLPYLPQSCIECMYILQRQTVGNQSLLA